MKIDWSIDFHWRLKHWLFIQVKLWKWRNTYHFVENSASFVLTIELLLTMLSNFERKVGLKDSTFWWVVCLTQNVLWPVYSLIINLGGLALQMVGISNTCSGLWPNGVGQNKKTDEEHDKDCAEEGFNWLR